MTKAIIFDLDSCLAAADEVGDHLYAPVFDAVRAANRGTVSEATLRDAFAESWRCAFDFIADKYGFSDAMCAAGFQAFVQVEVTVPMHGYDDLAVLLELPVQRFLVTSGFRRLQESKVKALGFAPWFVEIQIDAIDEPHRKGKYGIFQEILARHHLQPKEVLVVGDNPDSEIEAGNRLGLETIQILRPGVPRSDQATQHIRGLAGLKEMLLNRSRGRRD